MSPERQAGFSLVEALVAFAILAGVGIAVSAVMITGLAGISRARDAGIAMSIAQSQLALVQTNPSSMVGRTQGSVGSFRWTLRVDESALPIGRTGYTIYWADIDVSWKGARNQNHNIALRSAVIGSSG